MGGDRSGKTGGAQPRLPDEGSPHASQDATTRSEVGTAGNPDSTTRIPPGSFQLKLKRDESFLLARLPEKSPGRYGRWRQAAAIPVGQSHLHHASFASDERKILAQSGAEGAVRVYDRASGRLVAKHDFQVEPEGAGFLLAWDPLPGKMPGAPSYFALSNKHGVDLYDVMSGAPVAHLIDGAVRAMRLSADKSILVTEAPTGSTSSALSFFERPDERTALPLGTLQMEERVDAWDLSRDNRLLAVAEYPSDTLTVYDLRSGAQLLRVQAPKFSASVAFSPDGRWLAAGGKGLLLVDLVTPERRAFYSYFFNNINTVAFSPSGDALAASSYDGHIRLFHYDSSGPSLTLIRALRHTGRSNVYRIQFDEAGNSLVSASGDQTVRIFGGPYKPTSRSPEHDEFYPLEDWLAHVPESERVRRPQTPPSVKGSYYSPRRLEEPPRPSRIKPGKYSCRITSIYRLRDCTVTQTREGHTVLQFHEGNLLELQGVLYDDGPVVRYEAWEKSKGSVVDCPGCEMQPLHGVFRGQGNNFTGLLTFRAYYDPENPPPLPEPDAKIEEADDRFPLTLNFKAPLPPTPKGGRGELRHDLDSRLLPVP